MIYARGKAAKYTPVTGAGQVYSGGSSYAEYSSIQQAIYGQAVKPAGRFNDRT
jgi:hypothetical protein